MVFDETAPGNQEIANKESDKLFIQEVAGRLLEPVKQYLEDKPKALNVAGLELKLERYSEGGFDLDSVDFDCLRRELNFLVSRRGGEDLQADLDRVLEIQQKYQNG